MNKKLTASLMAALMSILTIAVPTLAATSLATYPSFLLDSTTKALSAYVVVGASAQTSDVVGAIDLATTLAQAAATTTQTACTGATQGVTGIERKIALPGASTAGAIGGTSANNLPAYLYTYHYSGLQQGQFAYLGTNHNYKEVVALSTSANALKLTHSLSSPVNGTLKMYVGTNAVQYQYQFLDSISASSFNATAASSTTYQNPIVVTVAGQPFQITAIPTTSSFDALSGNVGWIAQGATGLTLNGLSLEVSAVYTGTEASVKVVDANGNTVQDLGVMTTSSAPVFTYNGQSYSVILLGTATQGYAGGIASAQLAFSQGTSANNVYDGSSTATVSAWGADWVIAGNFQTAGVIKAGDNITVTYVPSSATQAVSNWQYHVAGSVFKGPGDYFELSYAGYTPSKFATVTIAPVTGVTIYNTTTATGYATNSSLNGLKISTDMSGTIVSGSTGYSEVYVLFGTTASAATYAGTYYWTGYYDKATSRIVQFTGTPSATGTILTDPIGASQNATFTLSYGGPGATATYTLVVPFSNSTLLNYPYVTNSSDVQVSMHFVNQTVAVASGAIPSIILGSGASTADTNDVRALVENTLSDVSSQPFNVIADGGVQVYSVDSNTLSNQVVLGIPPEQVYGDMQFGKVTAGTSGSTYTTTTIVPVTTAVAKLDSEITTTDEANMNLVLVGGPCVNTLVANLATAGSFDYKCEASSAGTQPVWPGSNFAIIKVVDGGFATGKVALVVAGTRADDTRLGTSVLQQYNLPAVSGKLVGTTVTVTGTTVATATITAA